MDGEFDDDAEAQPMEHIRDLIRSEGVRAAYRALREVCDDAKAPAPARATAGTALFRAAGLFEKAESDPAGKEPHEMTADELSRHSRNLQRQLTALRRKAPRTDNDSVFG